MFEGFDGQTSAPPSGGNQHWARQGVDATPAPSDGSLPSGHPMFRVNIRTASKTTAADIEKTGG